MNPEYTRTEEVKAAAAIVLSWSVSVLSWKKEKKKAYLDNGGAAQKKSKADMIVFLRVWTDDEAV